MEEKKEMSRKRRSRIWLRCTLIAVAVHAVILAIVCLATHNLNPTTSKIAWLTSSLKYEVMITSLPFAMSRWSDLIVWPIWFGILIPLFTSKRIPDDDYKVSLGAGLIFGLIFGLVGVLFFGLIGGLIVGLIFGLIFSLIVGLIAGLIGDLGIGLIGGLGAGLGTGLVGGLAFGLGTGLIAGLIVSLSIGLGIGLGKLIKLIRWLCRRSFWTTFWTTVGRWLIARDINGEPA